MKRRNELGPEIGAGEITPREIFEQRRTIIRAAAAGTFGAALAPFFARDALAQAESLARDYPHFQLAQLVVGDLLMARTRPMSSVGALMAGAAPGDGG